MSIRPITALYTETNENVEVLVPALRTGQHVYRHFKGGTYLMLGTCAHQDTKEILVVYREWTPIQPMVGKTFARPQDSWRELVVWPDVVKRPRFIQLRMCPYDGVPISDVPGNTGKECPACEGTIVHQPLRLSQQ